ncbi:hypothetical protein ABPG72_005266 [Tetrahymena utriculariae]
MEIEQISNTDSVIVFSLEFDNEKIELLPTARLIVNIFEEKIEKLKEGKTHQSYEKLLNMILKMPFRKQLKISQLQQSKAYKFNFILENGQDLIQKNVYAYTKASENPLLDLDEQYQDFAYHTKKTGKAKGLCESEDILYKAALANDVNKQVFKSDKEVLKKVMDARKSSNTQQYINESYKFAKPNSNKMERLKRTLIIAQGVELYENIYGYREGNDQRNGFQFGQNDWFMGPFYSYDHNSHSLKQKQIQKLTQEFEQQESQQSLRFKNSFQQRPNSSFQSQNPVQKKSQTVQNKMKF